MKKAISLIFIIIGFSSLIQADGTVETADGSLILKPANGRLGIGTTHPRSILHIEDTDTSYSPWTEDDRMIFEAFNDFYINFVGPVHRQQGLLFSDNVRARGYVVYHHNYDSLRFGTTSTERMRIDSQGDVGIGTTNPTYKLDISGSARATNFLSSSDVRFKNNVTAISNSLNKVSLMRGVYYNWNDLYLKKINNTSDSSRQIGFIAQEVERIVPEVVSKRNINGKDDYLSLDYGRLSALLVESIKELKSRTDELCNYNGKALKDGSEINLSYCN